MCGICVILRPGQLIDRSEIGAMTASLSHRGPDGQGILLRDSLALGHRRLSIIDPEGGAQPMSSDDQTIHLTYNGEIYNFMQLRKELEHFGHRFRTNCDTEVLLRSYEQWGRDCVLHLRGMFAFAIADERKKELFLARDHFGIKPLVYAESHGLFACASELNALKTLTDFPRDLDLTALDQYLWLQYIPAPRTIYQHAKKLPPAHRMTVGFDGCIRSVDRYWMAKNNVESPPRTEEQWTDALENVLQESVQTHLVSDVPFGSFLSGGVDSTAVTMYMSGHLKGQHKKTFSIGYKEEGFNELPFALIAAKKCDTDHHSAVIGPDIFSLLPSIVSHCGEPFGDSSILPTYAVSKLAREHVTMVLSGDGGDEMFAGYNTYIGWMNALAKKSHPDQSGLFQLLVQVFTNKHSRNEQLETWLGLIEYLSCGWRTRLWKKDYQSHVQSKLPLFEELFARTKSGSSIERVQSMDLQTYLPFDILAKVDAASMMHGLEVRTPFVDLRVQEFASQLPPGLRMRRNEKGEWQGKYLLKKLMERYFPADFVHRKKMGFALPAAEWFGVGGAWRSVIQQKLLDPHALIARYFDQSVVRELLEKGMTGPIWTLLVLEEWLKQEGESM